MKDVGFMVWELSNERWWFSQLAYFGKLERVGGSQEPVTPLINRKIAPCCLAGISLNLTINERICTALTLRMLDHIVLLMLAQLQPSNITTLLVLRKVNLITFWFTEYF